MYSETIFTTNLPFNNLVTKLISTAEYCSLKLGIIEFYREFDTAETGDVIYVLLVDYEIFFINRQMDYFSITIEEMECWEEDGFSIYRAHMPTAFMKDHLLLDEKVSAQLIRNYQTYKKNFQQIHTKSFLVDCQLYESVVEAKITPYIDTYFEMHINKQHLLETFCHFSSATWANSERADWHYLVDKDWYKRKCLVQGDSFIQLLAKNITSYSIAMKQLKYIVANLLIKTAYTAIAKELEQALPKLKEIKTSQLEPIIACLVNDDTWKQIYFSMERLTTYYLVKNNKEKASLDEKLKIYEEVCAVYTQYEVKYAESEFERQLKNAMKFKQDQVIIVTEMTMDMIDFMSGIEFEQFCAELFTKLGYAVTPTAITGDQGIDLIIKNDFLSMGIQAKRYSNKVTNTAVQEVVAGIAHYQLNKGLVLTNNYFTESAKQLAHSNNVILWDRDMLSIKLKEYNEKLKMATL